MHGDLVEESQHSEPDGGEITTTTKMKSASVYDPANLFKKGRTDQGHGYLKVKFLGNALKDYQLIRVANEGPTQLISGEPDDASTAKTLNTPSWIYFCRARKALGDPQMIFFIVLLVVLQWFVFFWGGADFFWF